jgi:leucyl/phenylalanyl-tRNA--protein transferase
MTDRVAAMIPQLTEKLWFPDPHIAESGEFEGLVALGGDLSVERLLLAYRSGIFPWSVRPITWWSPEPRGIFELDRVHIPRSLARVLRRRPFEVTRDRAFAEVIRACATAPRRDHTWISPEFISAYTELHRAGHAHSVECWLNGELVGGIYGVSVGGLFAGESMFHWASNASKVALVKLIDHLREQGFQLFDIQMVTPATEQLGAVEISRSSYLERLTKAVSLDVKF